MQQRPTGTHAQLRQGHIDVTANFAIIQTVVHYLQNFEKGFDVVPGWPTHINDDAEAMVLGFITETSKWKGTSVNKWHVNKIYSNGCFILEHAACG